MGVTNYPTTKNGFNKNRIKMISRVFGYISRNLTRKYYFAQPAAACMKTNSEISKNRLCADVESMASSALKTGMSRL